MAAYYNENDPFAAAWLRELIKAGLIADGEVDTRSIESVSPGDVRGFVQCHFFAGIGGWSYALRLAGWPDDETVWTGSCPCQPFSQAGKLSGRLDPRDLWPTWVRLIEVIRPLVVLGEQVEDAIAFGWWDVVSGDLERIGYACGSCGLPACAVNAPHDRGRLYFAADDCESTSIGRIAALWRDARPGQVESPRRIAEWPSRTSVPCGLDDGISNEVAKRLVSGFGNAIVPQVAAVFIEAYRDARRGAER